MPVGERTLAERLGVTVHVSPLRLKLLRLFKADSRTTAECLEDWLVDVANARGATIVTRENAPPPDWSPPEEKLVTNEELVVALCQPQCLDRPQILRPAAQLISRGAVNPRLLFQVAERERVERVLAELARQALRAEPDHPLWKHIAEVYKAQRPFRDSLLHWTRLAEPIMKNGRYNAERWRLVT